MRFIDVLVLVIFLAVGAIVVSKSAAAGQARIDQRASRCQEHAQVLIGADTGLGRLIAKEREQGRLSREDLDKGVAYRSVIRSGKWSTQCYEPVNK